MCHYCGYTSIQIILSDTYRYCKFGRFEYEFWCLMPLSAIIFSYIMAASFSGGGSRSTRREPPTLGKQLVNFITCGCEASEPFFVIYKLVIDLYELLDPTT